MLKAEHDRAGLIWKAPRSLDVAHLVQLLTPNLPSTSLEAIATWLDIEIRDRHRALGDAVMTAEIFLALLPKLRGKGIFTLAEAERACRRLTAKIDEEVRAGWQESEPAKRREAVRDHFHGSRVDSFPYRHRLQEIRHSPPVILSRETPVGQALHRMMAERISSVFLQPPREGEALAILTERDVLRAIDQTGVEALARPAGDFASQPLLSLHSDDFVFHAMRKMSAAAIRHLGVHDDAGKLIGALSARDLLKQRASEVITLGERIDKAKSSAELGSEWGGLASVTDALLREDVDVIDIAAIISGELRALTRRACEIAEQEFLESGKGPPPVPYAMLVLGSGGRGESLLAMDQDNAIVHEGGEPGSPSDQWFEALGQRIATILDEAGVSYCKGGIMASNAAWRMNLANWHKTAASWLKVNEPENLLSADIFFDGQTVHGKRELGQELFRNALEAARQSPPFLNALSAQAARFEVPVGWFGRFKLEDGRMDLKKGGLMTLFATARCLALRFGIAKTSTRARYLAARDRLEHGQEVIADLIEAHRIILGAILRQQLRDLDQGVQLSNSVQASSLSNLQSQNLKWALERIQSTRDLLDIPTPV